MISIFTRFFWITILFFSQESFAQVWQQITDFPSTERDDAVTFTIGNLTYCGTGMKPGWNASGDFYSFDMLTDSWAAIAALPSGNERQYSSGFSSNNYGFIACGIGSVYYNDVWMYDPVNNTWQAKTALPGAGRMGTSNFVINGIAYIIGGRTSSSTAIDEVWAYDIANDSWQQKNNFPFGARWRASATALNNKGYLIFGRDQHNIDQNQLFEYNPAFDSWTQISTFPDIGRTYSALISFTNDLIIMAGLDSLSNSYKDLWRFTPGTTTWQQLASIPSVGRRGGMCFTDNASIYYTTGIDQNNNRLKETWKITNPTSIAENPAKDLMHIFPNPANQTLQFTFNTNTINSINVEIIDNSGHTVKKETITPTNFEINTESFSNGLYLLKVDFENKLLCTKFVIAH